ncbi:hypothetical protein [Methylobacterium sp. GC_Met_2]|uniref:hypothetical protein n=1 Tax=Methylobacterium sp. GC_Met_2 TaxID=2937376 RepID=UPI00226BBD8A|nr:hypothetical protein [Methylobacterium sp. GC_Met_2]
MAIESTGVPVFVSGPAGPATVTTAAGLADVVLAIKAVLTAVDLPTARTALGLGNVANLAPADLPVSTATSAAIASLATLVAANQTTLNTILGGANPAVDTFIEAYNRFLADESAAAAMLAQINALQTALAGKAAAGANNDITALGQISGILDTAFGSTRGTVAVRGASGWAALGLGGSGTTLQSNGTDLVFAAASPGAGAVRYDAAQNLTLPQQLQIRRNAGDRGAGVLAKSAAYTVQAADIGSFIACTGSFALTLLAAASAGNAFAVEVKNAGTGVIALTPASGDAIDGLAAGTALKIYPGECCTLQCDGTVWRTYGLSTGMVLLGTQALSSTPAATFTRFDPSRFSSYVLDLVGVLPSADNNFLLGACSSDGGATFRSGATDYQYAYDNFQQDGATGLTVSNGGNTSFVFSNNVSNAIAISGAIEIRPGSSLSALSWNLKSSNYSGPKMCVAVGGGHTGPVTAFQLLLAGGNLASGQVTMYGRR